MDIKNILTNANFVAKKIGKYIIKYNFKCDQF